MAVALGVAGLLLQGTGDGIFGSDGGDDPPAEPTEAEATPLAIARSIDFDPEGDDGEENPDEAEAGLAYDGDPATSWSSVTYRSPEWGGLKPGVGLILELDQASAVRRVEVDSPLSGWEAEVYVAATADEDSLDGWGEPVGTFTTGDGTTSTAEVEAEGGAVLVWFTRANDGGGSSYVQIDEVRVFG